MKIIADSITLEELAKLAEARFGNMVKAVVDVDRETMAVDAELHADEEAALLETGAKQESLWGINLYPEIPEEEWVEFDSMINLRPGQGNRTRGVDDPDIRRRIIDIVKARIKR